MDYNKIRSTCKKVRIAVGIALIGAGVVTQNSWLYLGVVPLVAGVVDFCPLCIITKKCSL
jgi:hypothetical protein